MCRRSTCKAFFSSFRQRKSKKRGLLKEFICYMKSRLDEILPFINMNETTSKPLAVYEFEGVRVSKKSGSGVKTTCT